MPPPPPPAAPPSLAQPQLNTSTISGIGISASTTSSSASWQSIFWALLALAVNAMTQRSVLDGASPWSTHLYAARMSPVVCIGDAVHALALFMVCLCSGLRPLRAAHGVGELRFPGGDDGSTPGSSAATAAGSDGVGGANNGSDRGGGGGGGGDDASTRSLQGSNNKRARIRIIVRFILVASGALPQAVKLFAIKGILVTHVWAGAYLGSFVVLVMLDLLALLSRSVGASHGRTSVSLPHPGLDPRTKSLVTSYTTAFFYMALVVQMALSFWTVGAVLRKSEGGRKALTVLNAPGWLYVAFWREVISMMCMCWPSLLSAPLLARSIRRLLLGPNVLLCLCLPIGVVLMVAVQSFWILSLTVWEFAPFRWFMRLYGKSLDDLLQSAVLFAVVYTLALVIFLIVRAELDQARAGLAPRPRTRRWPRNAETGAFAIATFIAGVLHYALLLDPTGTIKPRWADKLG